MSISSKQIIILGAAVILATVLVFSDREAESAPEQAEVVEQVITADDVAIEKAFEILNGGGPPMEAIGILKELADREEDPSIEANHLLGQLSIQSGQMEKARERFLKVLDLEPNRLETVWEYAFLNMEMGALDIAVEGFTQCVENDESMSLGYFYIARCQEAMGFKEEALNSYRLFLPFSPDTVVSNSVKEFINRLEIEATTASDPNS